MADLQRILQIERESFLAYAWPGDLFRHYAAACPRLFLIAKVGRRIAGYSITCVDRPGAELVSIAVASRYRGHGIAKRLLRSTLRKLEGAAVRTLWLTVRPKNGAAIRLYRGLGFVRRNTIHKYYEDGSDGLRMRLKIGPK